MIALSARHPRDDVADPAPRVGIPTQEAELGLARLDREEAERRVEERRRSFTDEEATENPSAELERLTDCHARAVFPRIVFPPGP